MEILGMNRNENFQFSNDGSTYTMYEIEDFSQNTSNLMEEGTIKYDFFNYPQSSINYDKASFSFIISIPNEIQLTTEEKQANLSYYSLDDKKRKEIKKCFIKKIDSTYYNFSCSPTYDISTRIDSLQIKIDNNKNTRRRLSLFDKQKSITQLYPGVVLNANEKIDFEYNVTINNFIKKDDNGLSGGAIAGIVLGSVAAVVAIGIVIYCLIRKKSPKMPVNAANNANFQDSSINMNK